MIGDFLEPEDADTAVYDAEGCYVTPGFIDVHTHGGFGVDVNAATQEDYEKIGHFFAKEGTTSWHCSILTDTEEQTDWCIKEAVKHYETNTAAGQPHGNCADLMGIHLEGPFLASEYKGAMPEYLLRTADMPLLKHYQETAGMSKILLRWASKWLSVIPVRIMPHPGNVSMPVQQPQLIHLMRCACSISMSRPSWVRFLNRMYTAKLFAMADIFIRVLSVSF